MPDTQLPLFVSFSSGRTSAFMARYLQLRYPNRQMVFIFANVGKEKEESLIFANECDKRWNLGLIWVEAVITHEPGIGTTSKVVTFETAARNNAFRKDPTTPFEEMIKKYGIPSRSFPHCTRTLKIEAMHHYVKKVLGWKKYETAIGYRADEQHRATRSNKEVYPLIDEIKVDKEFVRNWWSRQDFDLQLKDYEGNCDLCWKKSQRKKWTILKENPDVGDWWMQMEAKYGSQRSGGEQFNFHQSNRSTIDLIKRSKQPFQPAVDGFRPGLTLNYLFDAELDDEMHCLCEST